MISLWQWHFDQARKARESRDIVEISRRDAEQRNFARHGHFKVQFNHVFGFEPELGDPVVTPSNQYNFWVQGFLFTIDNVGSENLFVRGVDGLWIGLATPAKFYKLVEEGKVVVDSD